MSQVNFVANFKTLPEAGAVPSCVRDAQDTLNEIYALDARRIELCKRLQREVEKMQQHLLQLWNATD